MPRTQNLKNLPRSEDLLYEEHMKVFLQSNDSFLPDVQPLIEIRV
jgi:hypothetical protein